MRRHIRIKNDCWVEKHEIYPTWEFAMPNELDRMYDVSFVGVI